MLLSRTDESDDPALWTTKDRKNRQIDELLESYHRQSQETRSRRNQRRETFSSYLWMMIFLKRDQVVARLGPAGGEWARSKRLSSRGTPGAKQQAVRKMDGLLTVPHMEPLLGYFAFYLTVPRRATRFNRLRS
ncbi:hypothetical protein QLX08_005961 [Tetragonisca angustula]|uniref:Uncharacterized protein n=1 Tax=Tetragonisca angustula TaxID=166442 RepID=A0AAW0ZVI5_9HYME